MPVLVADGTFFGLGPAVLNHAAGIDIRWAHFTKALAALNQTAGPANGFPGGISADLFHGPVPGCDHPLFIQGKQTLGHGIQNLV